MNKIVKLLNELMPGFAALVATLKGKPLDSITLKDVVEVAREIYGDTTEFILEVLKERLDEAKDGEPSEPETSSSSGTNEAISLAIHYL